MKTPLNQINSSIITPNRAADPNGVAGVEQAQPVRAQRAHIIDRRAARWARRNAH